MEKFTEAHNSEQGVEIRSKTYVYITESGKEKRIHRQWKVSTAKQQRTKDVNDYFDTNMDRIRGMKSIRQVMRDYNETHETPVSYNIIYKKYNSIFNTRKSRTRPVEEPVTHESNEQQVIENDSTDQEDIVI